MSSSFLATSHALDGNSPGPAVVTPDTTTRGEDIAAIERYGVISGATTSLYYRVALFQCLASSGSPVIYRRTPVPRKGSQALTLAK